MGPYPRNSTGKILTLVITDQCTRWLEAFPIGDSCIEPITRLLEDHIFTLFGYPRIIITGNGLQFIRFKWRRTCRRWESTPHVIPIYRPHANPTDGRNQEIKKGLHLQDEPHIQGTKHLMAILRYLRSRRYEATGYAPAEALLGYSWLEPGDCELQEGPPPQATQHPDRYTWLEEMKKNQCAYSTKRFADLVNVPQRFEKGQAVYTKPTPNQTRPTEGTEGSRHFCSVPTISGTCLTAVCTRLTAMASTSGYTPTR